MHQAVLLPPRHMETYYKGHDNILFRAYSSSDGEDIDKLM